MHPKKGIPVLKNPDVLVLSVLEQVMAVDEATDYGL